MKSQIIKWLSALQSMRCYIYDEFHILHSLVKVMAPVGCVCSLDMHCDNVRLFHYTIKRVLKGPFIKRNWSYMQIFSSPVALGLKRC
jgi:hypothetical protein